MYRMKTTLVYAVEDIQDTYSVPAIFDRMAQTFDPLGRVFGSKTDKLSLITEERYKAGQAEKGKLGKWMKRYLLFGASSFAAGDGWRTFLDSFHFVDEAKEAAEKRSDLVWAEVVDGAKGLVLFKGNRGERLRGIQMWERVTYEENNAECD